MISTIVVAKKKGVIHTETRVEDEVRSTPLYKTGKRRSHDFLWIPNLLVGWKGVISHSSKTSFGDVFAS